MTGRDTKNKPVILFGLGFAVAVLISLIANWHSALVRKVQFPLNNGVAYLFTCGNYLAAACHDAKLYVWDWRELKVSPKIVEVQSDQAVLLNSGHVASIRRSDAESLVLKNLEDNEVYKKIPIMAEGRHTYLATNQSGEVAAVVLSKEENNKIGNSQEIIIVDCNSGVTTTIIELQEESGDAIMGISISDDTRFVVLAGEKANQGWVALADVKEKQLNWTKQLSDLEKIRSAVFSTDGKVIYIRGTDSTVQVLDTKTGKVLRRLLPLKENRSTARDQPVQTLATSNDGRFMAATISGTVYVWDCTTEKVVFKKAPHHKLVSGIAFSPDSKYLATSDSRQGGVIQIWRLPKH
jgi:WD40 repeat protein